MSEIWTAEKKITKDGKEMIVFDVFDEATGKAREEYRYVAALPLMFIMGGYPPQIGMLMQTQNLPWRFRKQDDHIYLCGSDIGVKDYHPIDP